MPRRIREGGFTVFNPTIRPNVFSPVGVEDLIERRGESALWFRMQPCPCPSEKRLPDCLACVDGYVKSFQERLLIENERVYADGRTIFPRYAPVRKVVRTQWLGPGEGRPLSINQVHPDRIEVKEQLEEWHAVIADYEVDLIEAQTYEGIVVDNDIFVDIPTDSVVVAVEGVWLDVQEDDPGTPLEWTGVGFRRITLKERVTGIVSARVKVFNPVKIAYRTMDVGQQQTEKAGIPLESGEIEIIVPNSYLMGHGDIITFLTTTVRNAQYVSPRPGPVDMLTYTPVVEILNCFSKRRDARGNERIIQHEVGKDLILESAERVRWLTEKPMEGYSIMYSHHPSFRIQEETTVSGGLDRNLPRQFKAKAVSSYNVR